MIVPSRQHHPTPRRRERGRLARALAAVLLLAALPGTVAAQSLYDPADRVYRHLAIWERKGYLAPLPALRPFAPQLVIDLLRQVEKTGSALDRELAASYLRRLAPPRNPDALPLPGPQEPADGRCLDSGFDRLACHGVTVLPPVEVAAFGGAVLTTPRGGDTGSDAGDDHFRFGGGIESTARYGLFAYSAAFRYWWESTPQPALRYRFSPIPVFPNAGPNFDIGETSFSGREDLRASATFGTGAMHLRAGFGEGAFGSPFADSLVLGAGAPPTAHLVGALYGEHLSYTAAFLELVAERAAERDGKLYVLKNRARSDGFPAKYLVLHTLQWHALPWLSVDAFTASLFGARPSLYSLLPTAFITEPFTRDYDNTLAGLAAAVRLPAGFGAAASLYVDDYNTFVGEDTFNPSPFSNKTAGQALISWSPAPSNAIDTTGIVSLDYLFVAPYMYTHSSHQPINYLTYTHRARPLANNLRPNSDQVTLAALFTPLAWLDLELAARRIRHGNASARRDNRGPYDDGSIWDDGYDADGRATFVGPEPSLLDAPVLEEILQLEVAATAHLAAEPVAVRTRVGYSVEHVDNLDLNEGESATRHRFGVGVTVSL